MKYGLGGMDDIIAYTSACSRNNQTTEGRTVIVNYKHSCGTGAKVPDAPYKLGCSFHPKAVIC